MKKFIGFCLAVFLLAASLADAKTTMILCGKTYNDSDCVTQSTPNDMETSSSTYFNIGENSVNKYGSTKFVADATTGTICKICLDLNKVGSPTMNFDVQIWADSGGVPSSMVSNGDFTGMNAANIAGSFADCFTGGSAVLTNGTTYHVVIIADAVNGDNYFRIVKDSNCTTESMAIDADGASFTEIETNKCGMVKLYK
jgi:hypothetical protein